jgi:hypothetical protein
MLLRSGLLDTQEATVIQPQFQATHRKEPPINLQESTRSSKNRFYAKFFLLRPCVNG